MTDPRNSLLLRSLRTLLLLGLLTTMAGLSAQEEAVEELFEQALVLHREGKYPQAINYYSRYLDQSQSETKNYILLNRAQCYQLLGKPELALKDYAALVEAHPDFMTAWYNRAGLHNDMGNYTEAIADANKALTIGSIDSAAMASAYFQRGMAHYGLDHNAEAQRDFSMVLLFIPSDSEALYYRASCKVAAGDYDGAIEDLDLAISYAPGQPELYYERARLHGQTGDFEAAIEDLNLALARVPGSADIYAHRAAAYAAIDDSEAAVADYSRALELEGEPRAVLLYYRSEEYQKLGKAKLACADLVNAVTLSSQLPNLNSMARQRLQQICD